MDDLPQLLPLCSMPHLLEPSYTAAVSGNKTCYLFSRCSCYSCSSIEPAIFLSQPDSPLDDTIIKKYTKATLVDEPRRLGGNSFKLYILTTNPTPSPTLQSFTHGIQLLSSSAHQLQSIDSDQQW